MKVTAAFIKQPMVAAVGFNLTFWIMGLIKLNSSIIMLVLLQMTAIYTTPDAGQTWNLVFYNDDFYDIKSMDIFGDQLFITGNGGRILRLSVAYLSANQTNFKKNEATLYPNPAMNILNVTSGKKISEINIVNTLGTTISKHAQKGNIDISKLNTGVYFVEIIFSDKTKQVSKIIKE